jgi:starch-binding outer membrane protein, SusD/RagB family
MKTLLRSKLVIATAVMTTLGAITFACKNFLDQPTQGTLDESTLSNKTGVEASLIAAYRSLDCSSSSAGSWGCAASNWVWGSVPSTDAYKGSDAGDQQPINTIETYQWYVGEADTYINQKWAQVFEGVSRANATLRLLDKVLGEQGGPSDLPGLIDSANADGIRGEAIFLRAHYHFEAYRMWGSNTEPPGVGGIPYYRQTDLDYRKTNVGTNAIQEILTDLDSAIALLDVAPRGGDKGRASQWTAKAYKGRVQVYGAAATPAMWNDALTTLRDVELNGPYDLEASYDQVWTGRPQYRNGLETIWAYQASARDGAPDGWNSNWGERLNFPHGGSHFGCCGFHQPSFNLVNFFQVDAAGLPLALSNPSWNSPPIDPSPPPTDTTVPPNPPLPWLGQNFHAGLIRPIDPRLDWTVGRDNVPYKDWGVHLRGWIRDPLYSGPYSPKKNMHEAAAVGSAENNQGWVPTQLNNVPLHLFRYADMLLLLAEAEVEVGTLGNALAIVNRIRARAGMTAQGCGATDAVLDSLYPSCSGNTTMAAPMVHTAGVYDSLTTPWAVYRIGLYPASAFATQAAARQAVRLERRLELAMEGQHFFDLRRWGGADATISTYLTTEKTRIPYLNTAAVFTLPQYSRYPIPSVQIELSKVADSLRLTQNQGW